jgi:hypothetical protein
MATKTVRITAGGAAPDPVRLKLNQDDIDFENHTPRDCDVRFTGRSPFGRQSIPVPASGRENSGRQQGTQADERYDYEVIFRTGGQQQSFDPTVIIDR